MDSGSNKLEKWFSAVAFAEAGEYETAITMVGGAASVKKRAPILEKLSKYFAAAAFAEENCPDIATEILSGVTKRSFLETIGLRGVKVWYGSLSTDSASFLEEVGLKGVRVRYATIAI